MPTTRSLKDAAKDPLVKKEKAVSQKTDKESSTKKCALKILAAVIVGLAGGFVTSQLLKFRL
jgi:F0F1-type ATP synthase assembly protein I